MQPVKTTHFTRDFRRTSGGDRVVDGVKFLSFDVGVLRYAKISEDGQLWVQRRHGKTSYYVDVIGAGIPKTPTGKTKSFKTEEDAIRFAIQLGRDLKGAKNVG